MSLTSDQTRFAKLAVGLLGLLLCLSSGCARQLYRLQADKEVNYLVAQKSNDPRWDFPNFTIGMDTRARYFDPNDPDCPPMPYDDPASHRYMHCVAGKKGYPCWHMNGDWYQLENPQWKDLLTQYNQTAEDGSLKVTMNGSVCLAQVHSSDYRTQIEQIYLSALDVSTERYRFDVQFFGDSSTVFNHVGPARSPLGEQNTLLVGAAPGDSTLQLQKRFATGAELVVGFANSVVWQFAGPDTNVNTSLLNFSLVQPLLRGGGRVVVLETLTLAERTLLGNLRAFERYRQGFYTNTTVGGGNQSGVTRRGGFLGGTGLTGFTGTGAGGIGGVAAGVFGIQAGTQAGGGGGGGGTGFAGGGAGGVGGFVGLLQLKQTVRNAEANLNTQLRTLGLLEANLEAGLMDIVQVDSFRQNIETARATLLSAQVNYQQSLDTFKLTNINIPPDVAMDIDDSMLEQFQFLDPKTIAVQHSMDDFVNIVGQLPAEPDVAELQKALELLTTLRERLAEQFRSGDADVRAMESKVAERKRRMTPKQARSFDDQRNRMVEGLRDVETRFNNSEGTLENLRRSLGSESPGKITDEIVALGVGLSGLTQELALVKARARLETVTIPSVTLTSQKALDIARYNRLDWMNNRASLVDTWRLIAFNANALKAGLDLTFSGDVGNLGNNPVAFNGQNGSLRVGLRFDAPFTRRSERNTYRNALITYQQQRRSLYLYQDSVNLTLRTLLRTLDQLETNMEIQRRAVMIAIRRVDKTREDLNKPPAPVQPGQQVQALGPTAAQDLIFALNDLTSVQNNLISVVLNHYENRMLLYKELGIMELDDCGMWIDRPIEESEWLAEEQSAMPPEVPQEWLDEAGVTLDEVSPRTDVTENLVNPELEALAEFAREVRRGSRSLPEEGEQSGAESRKEKSASLSAPRVQAELAEIAAQGTQSSIEAPMSRSGSVGPKLRYATTPRSRLRRAGSNSNGIESSPRTSGIRESSNDPPHHPERSMDGPALRASATIGDGESSNRGRIGTASLADSNVDTAPAGAEPLSTVPERLDEGVNEPIAAEQAEPAGQRPPSGRRLRR